MEKEDDSESDCFWGFVGGFRHSNLLRHVWQSVETMAALAKRKRLVAVKLEMKTTNGATIRMNLKNQENVEVIGKFACFVHRWLVPAAGVLFVVVGLAKVASVFGGAELLGKPDPVFGFMWRELMVVAGLVEIAVGLVCLLGKSRLFRAGSLLFLGSGLLMYRGMYWGAGAEGACPCWGGLLEQVRTDHGKENWMAASILVYILLAGFAGVGTLGFGKRRNFYL